MILLEEADAERFDVMYSFAGLVTRDTEEAMAFIDEQLFKVTPSDRVEAKRRRRFEMERDLSWAG